MATASARLHEVMEQLTSKKITERKKAVDAVGALLSEDRRDALADGSWVLLARHAITCADHELAAAIKAKKPPRGEVGSLVANVVKWSDELRAAARTLSTRRGLDAAARTQDIPRRRVAATPRLRRGYFAEAARRGSDLGYSAETGRGGAAART